MAHSGYPDIYRNVGQVLEENNMKAEEDWKVLKTRLLERIKKIQYQHEQKTLQMNTQSDIWQRVHILIDADLLTREGEAYQRIFRTMDDLERGE